MGLGPTMVGMLSFVNFCCSDFSVNGCPSCYTSHSSLSSSPPSDFLPLISSVHLRRSNQPLRLRRSLTCSAISSPSLELGFEGSPSMVIVNFTMLLGNSPYFSSSDRADCNSRGGCVSLLSMNLPAASYAAKNFFQRFNCHRVEKENSNRMDMKSHPGKLNPDSDKCSITSGSRSVGYESPS
ncbi:uncharacterized protein LOC110689341 isoform X2 [Chenopodium quinoa]|uniref:uncharacterized protein LOC110689341 isoform X2 n=1 Tax=Chenopodium quinoa TaxID=63459 RepID=UPI000B783182|nr:uncharacterized protein LOC110689341 isoform X2 [Chenopodium quinoa]